MRDLYQKENLLRWTTYSKDDNTAICKYASFRKPIYKFSTIGNIQQCMDLPTQEYALLFWPKTGQDWPSMTQMKKLCHSCWFWARRLSGNAFIQDSHIQQPICPFQLLLSLFSGHIDNSLDDYFLQVLSLSSTIITKVFWFDPFYV